MPIEIKMDYDELSKVEDFDELTEVFDEDEDKSNRELFREIVGENIENAKLEASSNNNTTNDRRTV